MEIHVNNCILCMMITLKDQTDGGLYNDQTDADLHNDQTNVDLHNDHTLIFKFTYGNI